MKITEEGNGMGRVVLEVDELRTHFVTMWGIVNAVDGVSFTLGLVGESG
jgi:ABC-type dipeptide/oligopeptide/nickel transport system ATPase component